MVAVVGLRRDGIASVAIISSEIEYFMSALYFTIIDLTTFLPTYYTFIVISG